jgi:hypothetical protein
MATRGQFPQTGSCVAVRIFQHPVEFQHRFKDSGMLIPPEIATATPEAIR